MTMHSLEVGNLVIWSSTRHFLKLPKFPKLPIKLDLFFQKLKSGPHQATTEVLTRGSPKNAPKKGCQFFVTFPKYVNGVLETTFCTQITFGQAGTGQKWSKLAQFHKGLLHVTFGLRFVLFCFVACNFWVLFML